MSVATDSFTEIIHVRLLDEGVDVWRPVRARRLPSGVYELAADPVPADEVWEFEPGAQVTTKHRLLDQKRAIIAVSRSQKRAKPAGGR